MTEKDNLNIITKISLLNIKDRPNPVSFNLSIHLLSFTYILISSLIVESLILAQINVVNCFVASFSIF